MPAPIATYQTLRFLWSESKPVRDWLWSKLPSVKDAKRREVAEAHLAKLLDDANALAQALPPEDLEGKIDDRIERFRIDLQAAKLPKEEADLLTERASMFVRLLVTGPFSDLIALRARLAEVEAELLSQAKKQSDIERRLVLAEKSSDALERLRNQLMWAIILVPVLLIVVTVILGLILRK